MSLSFATLKIYLPYELLVKCQCEYSNYLLHIEDFEVQDHKIVVTSYEKLNTANDGAQSNLFIILNSSNKVQINRNYDLRIIIERKSLKIECNKRTSIINGFKKHLFLIYKSKQYNLINGFNKEKVDNEEITRNISKKYQEFENYKIFQYVVKNSEVLSNFLGLILLLIYSFNSSNQLKFISRVVSLLVNLFIGIAVFIFFYKNHDLHREWLNTQCLNIFENLVNWLTQIIYWLIGVPAGLKLNKQLNEFLGRFFFYHIYLWNASIDLFNEILPSITWFIIYIPVIGISFQLALVSDALNILTIHAQCFYGYARAIYKLEIDSLKSLFRLFRGKKFNPMRKRIDSYLYNIDQLFIGTLGLCIAFFLLPTILIYYVVFLGLQLLILSISYIFKNLINFLNNLPIYEIFLCIINSTRIQKHIHYEIDTQLSTTSTIAVCYINFKKMTLKELLEQSECKIFKLNLPNMKQVLMNILSGHEITKKCE